MPRERRHKVLKSDTGQASLANSMRIATSPCVCRKGRPKSAFRVRQVWIAASLKVAGRPRRPRGGASHSVSGSNQITSDPRCLRAALKDRQFVVR